MTRVGHLIKIEDPELQETLSQLVKAWGGYYNKICRRVNRIFSAVGQLSTALKLANSKNAPLRQPSNNCKPKKYGPLEKSIAIIILV